MLQTVTAVTSSHRANALETSNHPKTARSPYPYHSLHATHIQRYEISCMRDTEFKITNMQSLICSDTTLQCQQFHQSYSHKVLQNHKHAVVDLLRYYPSMSAVSPIVFSQGAAESQALTSDDVSAYPKASVTSELASPNPEAVDNECGSSLLALRLSGISPKGRRSQFHSQYSEPLGLPLPNSSKSSPPILAGGKSKST